MLPCKASAFPITIKYIIHKDSVYAKSKPINASLIDIVRNNWDNIDQNSQRELENSKKIISNSNNMEVIVVTYQVPAEGIYFLLEGMGHAWLLSPVSDTVTVSMRPFFLHRMLNGRSVPALNDSISSSWGWKFSFPKKEMYIGFFDSLAYIHGDLRANFQYTFKTSGNNLKNYLANIPRIYNDMVKFYHAFNMAFEMPKKLRYYALNEIQYWYYYNLIEPVADDPRVFDQYPDDIVRTINAIKKDMNNMDLFTNTSSYRRAMQDYVVRYEAGKLMTETPDSSYIANRIAYCNTYLKDGTKAFVLADLLRHAIRLNNAEAVSSIYKSYDHTNSPAGINEFVDDSYNGFTKTNFSPEAVLNLKFEDSAQNTRPFKEIVSKDIILVDCWATWCIPCREQMPFLDAFVNQYKDRVQFVSLSADQDVSRWSGWLSKTQDKNPNMLYLHAANGFDNVFFRRLLITEIPRYILLSKSGDILNAATPFPSAKEDFKKMLDQYLAEEKKQ